MSAAGQADRFESMLTGGHPNSLGRTVEVVDLVLGDRSHLGELYRCYFSEDEVVRLRVSSCMKRVCAAEPDWLVPYLDDLLETVSRIDQASTQWTLAQLFLMLGGRMNPAQHQRAVEVMKRNLTTSGDWIVLIQSAQTLADWAAEDAELRAWLLPRLNRLAGDRRKSVSKKAKRLLESLSEP